jgi:hypothetical protein
MPTIGIPSLWTSPVALEQSSTRRARFTSTASNAERRGLWTFAASITESTPTTACRIPSPVVRLTRTHRAGLVVSRYK